jgi:hypothetical protein
MKILNQTPQRLVIGTPASAVCLVRLLGLAISFPGVSVLLIFLLSGAADYSALTCQSSRPAERQCHFVRMSLIRPFYYRFSISEISGTRIQARQQSQRGTSIYRLVIQTGDRSFPLTVGYSRNRQQLLQQQTQIQQWQDDPMAASLVIRAWPKLSGLGLAIVFLIPTLPLTLLVIFIVAAPVIIDIDLTQRRLTVTHQGLFTPDQKQCSFQEVDQVVVQRLLVGGQTRGKTPTERYALLILLRSGQKLLRYDYFEKQPAEAIAQVIQQTLHPES